jgi:hypothetical protein
MKLNKKKYLQQHGTHCLFCGSPLVESGTPHIADGNDDELRAYVECTGCKRRWIDVYKLTNVIPVKP